MKTCAACGTENPDVARFCLACGTPLVEAPPAPEQRKVVTIVFSDLKGSTTLGESLEPEALREVMTRYFDAMRWELERHGGVVEKFIGDAVMAVFGLPRLHEDDALRAVRAASGMQAALEQLNAELAVVYGVTLVNRTGVNTGQVVAGDPTAGQRLVTGDAVNVAARLEQAAGESEVLLGALTHRLVRDHVEAEEVEPLTLKGKSEPVRAFRLLDLQSRAPGGDSPPLVGRTRELEQLHRLLDEAEASRSARLVTIAADAGLGKTRLAAELALTRSGTAEVLRGRCLPYGDGITLWPLADAIRRRAEIGDDDDAVSASAKLACLAGDAGEGVTERLAAVVGLSPEPYPVDDLLWAFRSLLAHLARERPVLLVVEDVHWAEPTLLELLTRLLESSEYPLLIVCPCRPELLETHPDWPPSERATRMVLEPLEDAATAALLASALGGSVSGEILDRVVDAAGGNPLYAEQLLQMLADDGRIHEQDGLWVAAGRIESITVPPSIQALLAARLDALTNDERAIVQPAAVVGYQFAEGAVRALVPETREATVGPGLVALTAKQLVQELEGGEPGVHRFQHIMVRDTAYDGILKRARAELHERFVAWADEANRDRGVEFEEILGYHLEQAWRYRSELGPLDERGRALGVDGARRLASAGRRAFARDDVPGAATLLRRATALLPEDEPTRVGLLAELGEALLVLGRYGEASEALGEAERHAALAPAAAARASLARLLLQLRRGDAEGWRQGAVERVVASAMVVFEAEADHAGLAFAFGLLAWSAGTACRYGEAAEAAERAVEHARIAGDVRLERGAATAYAAAASLGSTLIDEAIARCESCLEQTAGSRRAEGNLLVCLATLYAMQGAFDHARGLVGRGRELLSEAGLELDVARADFEAWRVETFAGEPEAAEPILRRSYEALDALGERYFLSTVAGFLAQSVLNRGGSPDEAQELIDRSRSLATDDDVDTQALWRRAHARLAARLGRHDEAERLVKEALALLEQTDATNTRLYASLDHGEILLAAGRPEEARAAYEAARELALVKGAVVPLETVLRRLEALEASTLSG